MGRNVRITKVPEMGSVENEKRSQPSPGDNNRFYGNDPEIKINRTLKPTTPDNATLEAERGETVVTNLNHDGIPEFYTIGGKRHSRGGTFLNLPENSFIYSRKKELNIRDADALDAFGITNKKALKKGVLPADISKAYDLNEYHEILANPFSDKLQRETAELMIQNYNLKLGNLALTQESIKGFKKGVPQVAMSYLEHIGVSPDEIMGVAQQEPQLEQFARGGEKKSGRRVRITAAPQPPRRKIMVTGLPRYEKGSEVKDRSNQKQRLPKGAKGWDPNKEGYDESKIKPGHYVLKNGVWHKYKGSKKSKYTGELDADKNLGDFAETYSLLRDKLNDPANAKAFAAAAREKMKNAKPNKATGLKKSEMIENINNLSDEEIVKKFLKVEKAFYVLNSKKGNVKSIKGSKQWDHDMAQAQKEIKALGYDITDANDNAIFQAGFAGLHSLANNDETKNAWGDFELNQFGNANDYGAGTGAKDISDIDGYVGDTTAGQIAMVKANEMDLEEAAWSDNPVKEDTEHYNAVTQGTEQPWFVQDQLNVGNDFMDLAGVKKDATWVPTVQPHFMDPTFISEAGTISALNSGAAGLAEASSNLGSPNVQAAINAKLQAGMLPGIMKAQQFAHTTNTRSANDAHKFNAQAANRFEPLQAQLQQRAFDNPIIADKLYRNAKRDARNNLVTSINAGITNAANANTMNQMYPQYHIDPSRGGSMYHTGVNPGVKANEINKSNLSTAAARLMDENKGLEWKEAIQLAKGDAGLPVNQGLPVGVNANQIQSPYTGYAG